MSSFAATFAPPVFTDVLVDGQSVEIRFARVEFPQWAEWESRIKKDRRDYIRQCLQEGGAPDAALVKFPIEQTAKEIPLAELAQIVTTSATYTRELLINQAVAGGLDKPAATKAVNAMPPMDRQSLASLIVTEDFKQEEDRPLLVPLTRNPPLDLAAAITETEKRLTKLKAMLPEASTGPSDSPASAPSSRSSTLAA